MPDELRTLEVVKAGQLRQAAELIFEYIAATQSKIAQRVPATPADLPLTLRTEYDDPRTAYPFPGTILLADRAAFPVGCVALKPTGPATAEVKRLYVRPAYRGGVGRALMHRLHEHAVEHGIRRLVLDVLATRGHAIKLYRSLGYTELDSPPTTAVQLLFMERKLA